MYNIKPRDLEVYLEKMKIYGEKDSERKTLKISEKEYVIFDYITTNFQLTEIVSDESKEENIIEIGGKKFKDKDFLLSEYQIQKEYKEKYYKDKKYVENEKINEIIKQILKNEILLAIIILIFMGIGPTIATTLKFEGFLGLFFSLITPLLGMIALNNLSKKE